MAAHLRLTLVVLVTATNSVFAQEWTRFRGPNGSGVSRSATVPARWTLDDFNWRGRLPGVGHSSPVLWGDRVFLTSGDEASATRFILCVDAADGRVLWSRKYASTAHRKHKLNSFASPTAVVDRHRVYVCWATNKSLIATALDHNGKQQWQADLGPFTGGYGPGVSPIVHDGMLIIGNEHQGDSSLIALECKSGRVRWRVGRKTKVTYSTPCVFQQKGRPAELIFTNWKHGITAVNASTGETSWEISVFDQKHVETAIASPIVVGDLVLGTCGWLGYATHTVAVRPDRSKLGAGQEVYRVDRGAPLTTTPVANDELLVLWADNGIVTCVDVRSGEVYWRKRVGGQYYGSPVIVGDHVYCLSASGQAVVLAASKDYRLVARNPLGEGSHSTPAVGSGTMLLRTFSKLISIGGKK